MKPFLRSIVSLFLLILYGSLSLPLQAADCHGQQILTSTTCTGDGVESEELKLYQLVNDYRAQYGLPAISLSKSLTLVANRHVLDLAENIGSLTHGWSNCPYDAGDANSYSCMWKAPQRFGTVYPGYGYENAHGGSAGYTVTANSAMTSWKNSSPHNAVILNQGVWQKRPWNALGVGIYKGYAVLWFGEEVDPVGSPTGASATPTTPAHNGGYLVTPELWINASIQSVEKGTISALWHKGGEAPTSRGDKVIWGYFYANPVDVSWGNENNPDAFVKIWYDVSGRVDVNFFHVSVPDIEVYSSLEKISTPATSTITMSRRYGRHTYQPTVGTVTTESPYTVEIPGATPVIGDPKHNVLSIQNMQIGATIQSVEKGSIDGVWRLGGQGTTSRGDQVVWGFFYANPKDVTWGQAENPDLYVKVWYDAVAKRIDVNFFHVSVPNIKTYSGFTSASYDKGSTTTLEGRYTRHEYLQSSTPPTTPTNNDPYSTFRQQCVNTINQYRATLNLSALQRWTEQESCVDNEAKGDSEKGQSHANFGNCQEMAQNECPGYPSLESINTTCLKQMWDEGPGEPYSAHGHYINMTGNYTKVACGFYKMANGKIWAIQNFR